MNHLPATEFIIDLLASGQCQRKLRSSTTDQSDSKEISQFRTRKERNLDSPDARWSACAAAAIPKTSRSATAPTGAPVSNRYAPHGICRRPSPKCKRSRPEGRLG